MAAKQATQTIPIVFVAMGDPVASGVVASLARPGANVTGTTRMISEMSAKQNPRAARRVNAVLHEYADHLPNRRLRLAMSAAA